MKMVKGQVWDVKFPKKYLRLICLTLESKGYDFKKNQWYLKLIEKMSDITPDEKRRPGDICIKNKVVYLISQLLHGDAKHYDSEEDRQKIFKECLDKLPELFQTLQTKDPELNRRQQIIVPYMIGSSDKDGWKIRKKMLEEFEKEHNIEVLIFVSPDYLKKESKN